MNPIPWLTEEEINDLCKPLRQRAAQSRRLCHLLGIRELPRRADGLPLVGRKMAEERLNGKMVSASFNWSK